MPPATASRIHARSDRRLGVGMAVSVLLHGVLLSLQFGVPGLETGSGGALSIILTAPPAPPAVAVLAAADPAPPTPPMPAAAPPAPVPASGMRLVDLPPAPAPEPAPAPVAKSAPQPRLAAPKRRLRAVPPPLIAIAPDPASEFAVALPEVMLDPTSAPGVPDDPAEAAAASMEAETATTLPEVDAQQALARLAEEEAQARLMEQERVERQARIDSEQRLAQELRDEEEREQRAMAALEQQRLERAAREQAEREQAELARLREEQDLAARRTAQQDAERALAERLRQEEDAARLAQEQAERERLERQRHEQQRLAEDAERVRIAELAQQQRQREEAARRAAEAQARETARLAAERAEEAARLAARRQPQPGLAQQGDAAGRGAGAGVDGLPRAGASDGLPGNRARELLRGLTIPQVSVPAAAREAASAARRVVADGGERDAPLRLYVDSVRQKLERNAVLGGARLSLREVRIDPLVSVALRSDGSVEDVTIVRSSGRSDMDDAVRRFVRLNARYSAFPPNVAARFDVIEIRRIWRFGEGLKLIEEMR